MDGLSQGHAVPACKIVLNRPIPVLIWSVDHQFNVNVSKATFDLHGDTSCAISNPNWSFI